MERERAPDVSVEVYGPGGIVSCVSTAGPDIAHCPADVRLFEILRFSGAAPAFEPESDESMSAARSPHDQLETPGSRRDTGRGHVAGHAVLRILCEILMRARPARNGIGVPDHETPGGRSGSGRTLASRSPTDHGLRAGGAPL